MPNEPIRQVSFNAGELDPEVDARRDTKTYFAGLSLAENLVPSPLGPIARRPGFKFLDFVRHKLADHPLAVGMITLPHGGDPAKLLLVDNDPVLTVDDIDGANQVVAIIDFGTPVEVHCVDVFNYAVKEGVTAPAEPPFQYPYDPPVFDGPVDPGIIFEGGGISIIP